MFDRITVDPEVYHGEPCIRGMRIPVYLVAELVAAGMSFGDIIENYPDLEKEDIKESLQYAAEAVRQRDSRRP